MLSNQNLPPPVPALSAPVANSTKPTKATNSTFLQLTSRASLLQAANTALAGKRSRPRYYHFFLNLGQELFTLQRELRNDSYQPQPPKVFTIFCNCGQKTRQITSMAVRDCVVQHALYRLLYDTFDPSFIADSFGCRVGKGTLRAADRCQYFVRHSAPDSYYLQLDVRKFYYSLRHDVLRAAIASKISDPRVLDLCLQFVNHDAGVGVPVGAVIAQVYGLIYLNSLDHYIKRTLHVKHYVRYVDDMVIIGESKERCYELRHAIERYLKDKLGLELSVAIIQPLRHGINFAGHITRAKSRRVRKFSLRNFKRNVKRGARKVKSMQAQMAHAQHSASYGHMLHTITTTAPHLIPLFHGAAHTNLVAYKRRYDLLQSANHH